MSFSNSLTRRITSIEEWIEARRLPLVCSPLRLFALGVLFLLIMFGNLFAVLRWPIAAARRRWRGTETDAPGKPQAVDAAALQNLLQQPRPVVVDFWAEWCAPCLLLGGILEEFAERHADDVVVAKVDSTKHPKLAKAHQVNALPTLLLFKDGNEVNRHLGPLTIERLEEFVLNEPDRSRSG